MKVSRIFWLAALAIWPAIVDTSLAADGNWRERVSAEEEITPSDVTAEVAFGREISARILGRYHVYDATALTMYVNLVGHSLARNTNRPELNFHFAVLDTGDVNAYAAPGGYVFVTTGALRLMNDESELAGVLAHEIAHVTEMHVVKELNIKGIDESTVSGLAQLAGASSESARAAFTQAVNKGFDMISKNEYKREDELQADKVAVTICALTGYEASALARYLERTRAIKENGKILDIGGTHPPFSLRIAQINDSVVKNGGEVGSRSAQNRFADAVKDLKPSGLGI